MDAVSAAASLLALAELATKVALSCNNYYRAVKDANAHISRLQGRVQHLQQILVKAGELYEGFPDGQLIAADMPLYLNTCNTQLTDIDNKLQPSSRSLLRKKLDKLTWPFKEKHMAKLIENLGAVQQDILLAMQIDQSTTLKSLQLTQDHLLLPIAEGASFDSFSDQLNARCHEKTRIGVRQQIRDWFYGGSGIFWLNGMAGTGKSTILRSMAQEFHDHKRLGATFFFKRSEGDRGEATRFITTIARQLTEHIPKLVILIREACKLSPQIHNKTMAEQVQQLILQPMEKYIQQQPKSFLIIVDALDECDDPENTKLIVQLLSQIASSTNGIARVLLSSRPELPIRSAFNKLPSMMYTSFALQDVLESVVKDDLEIFVRYELLALRNDNEDLAADWPSKEQVEQLLEIVHPLFIAAATACRFISDPRWHPEQQLEIILRNDNANQSHGLARIYQPILNQMLVNLDQEQETAILDEFRLVVGSIIVLEDAVSVNTLAALLDTSKKIIKTRLSMLHSVVLVPMDDDQPVKFLHLSFRNFLATADPKSNPFAIDEATIHETVAIACLRLLHSTPSLKQDICDLGDPGIHRDQISDDLVFSRLSNEVRYACSYWADHIRGCHGHNLDEHLVYDFLKTRFVHWFEALVLLGRHFDAKIMLMHVQTLYMAGVNSDLSRFLEDAIVFVQNTQSMLDMYPLQLYSSALVFTPKQSLIRTTFESCIPTVIGGLPMAQDLYNDSFQSFPYHIANVRSVALSPDDKQFATCDMHGLVKLWETDTGRLQHILYGHSSGVVEVEFILEGRLLLSQSFGKNEEILIWDTEKGSLKQILKREPTRWQAVSSNNGQMLAVWARSTNSPLELLSLQSGDKRQLGKPEQKRWAGVRFMHDDRRLAAFEGSQKVVVFEVSSGDEIIAFEMPKSNLRYSPLAFSPSDHLLAAPGCDGISVWSMTDEASELFIPYFWSDSFTFFLDNSRLLCTAAYNIRISVWNLEICDWDPDYKHAEQPFTFSSDGCFLFTGRYGREIVIWNIHTNKIEQTIKKAMKLDDTMLSFRDNRRLLLRTSESIELWDLVKTTCLYNIQRAKTEILSTHLSPGNSFLATSLSDGSITIWDLPTEGAAYSIRDCTFRRFSFSGRYCVVGAKNGGKMDVWDTKIRGVCLTIPYNVTPFVLGFSPDESLLITMEWGCDIILWSIINGERVRAFQCEVDLQLFSATFSSNNKYVILVFIRGHSESKRRPEDENIQVWDHGSGTLIHTFSIPAHPKPVGLYTYEEYLLIFWFDSLYLFTFDGGKMTGQQGFCFNLQWTYVQDQPDTKEQLSLEISSTEVKISDITSGQLVKYKKLPTNLSLQQTHLQFFADSKHTHTYLGMVYKMEGDVLKISPRRNRITRRSDWLFVDGKQTLWLPTQYRATSLCENHEKLALAFMTGEIVVLDHDTGGMQRLKLPVAGIEIKDH